MRKVSKQEKYFVLSCLFFVILLAGIKFRPVAARQDALHAPQTRTEAFSLDLNAATEADLATLPGIGEVLAARIVAYRKEHGAFRTREELTRVRGIGEAKYAAIAEYLYV